MQTKLRYLSGAHHENTAAVAHQAGIGLLNTWKIGYSTSTMARYPFFALDNGAYSKGADHADFDFGRWQRWMVKRADQLAEAGLTDRCLFAVVPDAIDVDTTGREVTSHPAETLRRFAQWAPWLRQLGYRTALVLQPGMRPSEIPWQLVDVVFIGGDTAWKTSADGAGRAVRFAQKLGKPVHMGRVNTKDRLQLAASWGIDTADGTCCGHGNDANLGPLVRWLADLAA